MRNYRYVLLLLLTMLRCVSSQSAEKNYLFKNGQSDYTIVVDIRASLSEKAAANDLAGYLQKIGGVKIPVSNDLHTMGPCVYVGYNWRVAKLTAASRPVDDDEAFCYQTIGNDLLIYGGNQRGTMYGVFTFLERELGVHWLTSNATQLPRLRDYQLPNLYYTDRPVIQRRLDFYYDALTHHEWLAHNLLNEQCNLVENQYGRLASYWGIHTFEKLIPPATYFKSHPEYFSVKDGQRSDKAQLCLSNKAMRHELIKNLKEAIRQNPGYWCYDVSQNDNPWPCECSACQRLVKKYGSESGVMVWFVNQVAAAVKKEFPHVLIGTFAYLYTRQAPKGKIRLADNVVVRLCDIECCMAHPLDGCEQNSSFLQDMNDWRSIASHIYIWDYTVGFQHYLLPFPNFRTLAANYQYFSRSNVIGVMEEGAHNAPWSEFSELKQWMIAKLLWNPYQDTDSLASVFINAYYGKAALQVMQYYQLCQHLVTADSHFTIAINSGHPLFTDSFIQDGQLLLKKAETAVRSDKETLRRVQRLSAQLYYMRIKKNPVVSAADGTLNNFKQILRTDSTLISESGYTLEKLLRDTGYH